MRVLILGDAASIHIQSWVSELVLRGDRVTVLSFRPAQMAEAKVIYCGKLSVFNFLRGLWTVLALAGEERFDLIHAHYVSSYGLLAALGKKSIPLVLSVWGSDLLVIAPKNFLTRLLTRFTLSRAVMVFADSTELLDQCKIFGVPRDRLVKVIWGVPLRKMADIPGTLGACFNFVSIRNHEPIYRVDKIIRAFQELLKTSNRSVRLLICGQGSQTETLKRLVGELGIESQVDFLGHLDSAGFYKVLKGSQIAISVPRSDGTSMAMLESMAAGLGLIVSDLPANREWLGTDGAIYVDSVENELPTAMQSLLEQLARTAEMRKRNEALAFQKLNRDEQFDRVRELYRLCLEGKEHE